MSGLFMQPFGVNERGERSTKSHPAFENETKTPPTARTTLSRFISSDGFSLVRARTSQLELQFQAQMRPNSSTGIKSEDTFRSLSRAVN